jgi:transcriptional regulator with PAS, ATPase and Fis domain
MGPKIYGIFDENHGPRPRKPDVTVPDDPSLQKALEGFEKQYIEAVLVRNNGNRTHAARMLKIGIRTLQRKIKAYGIQ